jgi:5'(3')-deoxyribonucleotidase
MDKPIFLLDMDGLVVDTHTPWLALYNADYNDDLQVKDIVKWEMHELVKRECGTYIYQYLEDPRLYDNALPMEGAIEGINVLEAYGDVFCLTSGNYQGTFEWMARHRLLNKKNWREATNVIVANKKGMIAGDLIVDDYIPNLDCGSRKMRLVFDQPWNQQEEYLHQRVTDWQHLTNLVIAHCEHGLLRCSC